MHSRQNALDNWLMQTLSCQDFSLHPLSGDASFRRYFRLHYQGLTRLVMDAPPGKECLKTFIDLADFFRNCGLLTPKIYAANEAEGFAIIDDFGDNLFLSQLSDSTTDDLYNLAIQNLLTLQQSPLSGDYNFPPFNKTFMQAELNLFKDWFLTAYLKLELTAHEQQVMQNTFDWLLAEILQQPQVVIHRDYHARNLMLTGSDFNHRLATIDFQDAMRGPFTYDLVSLLKDSYVKLPPEIIKHWVTLFYSQSPNVKGWDFPMFFRAFELCGLQRHLKVLGIFCRLHLRDGKSSYLQNLPLTLYNAMACLETYQELRDFYNLMQKKVRLP